MAECQNCGSEVTDSFVRVFGNNEREVYGCPRCSTFSAIMEGHAADPEP